MNSTRRVEDDCCCVKPYFPGRNTEVSLREAARGPHHPHNYLKHWMAGSRAGEQGGIRGSQAIPREYCRKNIGLRAFRIICRNNRSLVDFLDFVTYL